MTDDMRQIIERAEGEGLRIQSGTRKEFVHIPMEDWQKMKDWVEELEGRIAFLSSDAERIAQLEAAIRQHRDERGGR